MDNACKAAVSTALAGGYLLGRTRKAKFAFAVATYIAGRRFSLSPSRLAGQGVRQLNEHPKLADLREQVRHELVTATRSAVSSTIDRRFAAMAESLRERSSREHDADDEDVSEDRDEEAPDHGDERTDDSDGESGSQARPSHDRGRRQPRTARKNEADQDSSDGEDPKHSQAKKSALRAPAKKTAPAQKAAPKRTSTRKTASRPTKLPSNRRGR